MCKGLNFRSLLGKKDRIPCWTAVFVSTGWVVCLSCHALRPPFERSRFPMEQPGGYIPVNWEPFFAYFFWFGETKISLLLTTNISKISQNYLKVSVTQLVTFLEVSQNFPGPVSINYNSNPKPLTDGQMAFCDLSHRDYQSFPGGFCHPTVVSFDFFTYFLNKKNK